MENEEEKEKKDKAKAAELVRQMINTEGWQQVIRPNLMAMKEGAIRRLQSSNKYEDLICAQQRFNAIDWLLQSVEITVAEGEQAEELENSEHPSS